MIDELLCAPIPDNCVAVCLISDNAAVFLCRSGQCLIVSDDVDALVRQPEGLKRIIVRGEHATATNISNLCPGVIARLLECMLKAHEAPDNPSPDAPAIVLDPQNPSDRARQMIDQAPEVDRFARLLLRTRPTGPAPATEPAWASALGVSRAPRAAREPLLEAIGDFGRQVDNQELVDLAKALGESLRARDASVGQKR